MDGGHSNPTTGLYKEYMTSENIVNLFQKYDVPKAFDHMTVDIDLNTFWVLRVRFRKYHACSFIIISSQSESAHPLLPIEGCPRCGVSVPISCRRSELRLPLDSSVCLCPQHAL